METKKIECGGFEYEINFHRKESNIIFDVVDHVTINGNVEDDIVISGRINRFGICKFDGFCDVHAAMALGELMKFIYEESMCMIGEG